MNWQASLAKVVTVEEYYIHVDAKRGRMQFRVRYVVHNGYTVIEPLDYSSSPLTQDFEQWLKLRIDLNTRYDKPHWYHPIKFGRKKKIVKWALKAIKVAYDQYYQENIRRKP